MSITPGSTSPTAHQRPGLMGMGRTSGQRSAELIAAFHALLTPSQETKALSRPMGRFLARLISIVARNRPALNMIPNRRGTITHLVRDHLQQNPQCQVVEVAAGLSTRGLLLGDDFPQSQFIEVDLPDVIATKRKRLSQHHLQPPANLTWMTADLVHTPLVDVLDGTDADIIIAEGLLLYFSPIDATSIMKSLLAALKPGGILIVDIFNRSEIRALLDGSNSKIAYKLFTRVTGKFQGMVDTLDEAQSWMDNAGGSDIHLHLLSDSAQQYDLLQPVRDIALIATCRKS